MCKKYKPTIYVVIFVCFLFQAGKSAIYDHFSFLLAAPLKHTSTEAERLMGVVIRLAVCKTANKILLHHVVDSGVHAANYLANGWSR